MGYCYDSKGDRMSVMKGVGRAKEWKRRQGGGYASSGGSDATAELSCSSPPSSEDSSA